MDLEKDKVKLEEDKVKYKKEKKKLWDWKRPTFLKSLIMVLCSALIGCINYKVLIAVMLCILLSLVVWAIWYLIVFP